MELDLPSPRPKARYAHALVRVDQRVLLCGGGGETATSEPLRALESAPSLASAAGLRD